MPISDNFISFLFLHANFLKILSIAKFQLFDTTNRDWFIFLPIVYNAQIPRVYLRSLAFDKTYKVSRTLLKKRQIVICPAYSICCKSFAHSLVDTLEWIKLYAAPTLCVYTAFFTLFYELLTAWFHQFLIWNSECLIFLTKQIVLKKINQ